RLEARGGAPSPRRDRGGPRAPRPRPAPDRPAPAGRGRGDLAAHGGASRAASPRPAALRGGLVPVPEATLSLAPLATASAVRTGAALAGILFVTTSVVAARGAARLALAAVVAAAFQGLYGTLVLASGHARIWNVPKTAYLDSATGTFVNHNHYAAFLAATLPLGLGLSIAIARRAGGRPERKRALLEALGPEGSLAA